MANHSNWVDIVWWLSQPSEEWWSSSVGMMTFPTEWKKMFQTTNHYLYILDIRIIKKLTDTRRQKIGWWLFPQLSDHQWLQFMESNHTYYFRPRRIEIVIYQRHCHGVGVSPSAEDSKGPAMQWADANPMPRLRNSPSPPEIAPKRRNCFVYLDLPK